MAYAKLNQDVGKDFGYKRMDHSPGGTAVPIWLMLNLVDTFFRIRLRWC
jgi:hypothetical protein